jgi:hypothetical protein
MLFSCHYHLRNAPDSKKFNIDKELIVRLQGNNENQLNRLRKISKIFLKDH